MSRFTILPLSGPDGSCRPCWIVQNNATGQPVKALPPRPEPLRFYSLDAAQAWTDKNDIKSGAVTS